MATKNLEELLKQDMVAVLRNNDQPEDVIQAELKDGLEEKSLVATLKTIAKRPEFQSALKRMLVESIEMRGIAPGIMVMTLYMGDVAGVKAIQKVKEDYNEFKKGLKGAAYGEKGIARA